MDIAYDNMLQMMDVAMLEPSTTFSQIKGLAQAAIDEGFGQICIHSLHVKTAADVLGRSAPKIVACVGFPMGVITTELKVAETQQAIADGAHEIDMVLSLTSFLDGDLPAGGGRHPHRGPRGGRRAGESDHRDLLSQPPAEGRRLAPGAERRRGLRENLDRLQPGPGGNV